MLPCWPGKLHCCSSTAAAVYQGRLGQGCQVTAAAVQVVQILLLQGRVGQNVYSYTHVCCFPGPETGAWQALRCCLCTSAAAIIGNAVQFNMETI